MSVFESSSDHHRKREFISRRKFWMEAGMGIGGLALLDLLSQDRLLGAETAPGPAACVGGAGRRLAAAAQASAFQAARQSR